MALAAAVGLPDSYAGELPSAFVTLKPGMSATQAELVAFAAERVPEPAAAPKLIWLIEKMPMTPIGKIFKPTLRAQAACHAVAAALRDAMPDPTGIESGEQPNEVVVTVADLTSEREASMRAAVRGMPLHVSFVAPQSDPLGGAGP